VHPQLHVGKSSNNSKSTVIALALWGLQKHIGTILFVVVLPKAPRQVLSPLGKVLMIAKVHCLPGPFGQGENS